MSEDGITEGMLDMVAIQRCLRQFRGDWQMNIVWLTEQAKLDSGFQDDLKRALVLMERDREEGLCEELLVDEIFDIVGVLKRDDLIDVRRYCELLKRAHGVVAERDVDEDGDVEWWEE
jgi:hypothetical protein